MGSRWAADGQRFWEQAKIFVNGAINDRIGSFKEIKWVVNEQ